MNSRRFLLVLLLISTTAALGMVEDLRECIERLRLTASSETVFVVSAEGKVVAVSGNAEGLLGYTNAELVGKGLVDLAADGNADRLRRFLASEAFPPRDLTTLLFRRKNGATRDIDVVSGELLSSPEGKLRVFLTRAAGGHVESPRFAQVLLDALPYHVAILDEQGIILYVNEGWKTYARENGFVGSNYGIGSNYLAACNSADGHAVKVATYLRETLSGQRQTFTQIYPCHGPAGRFWYALNGGSFNLDGRRRILLIHENVTDRKFLEERLSDAERTELVGRMVGGFAHHFNNILTTISGNLDLALQNTNSDHPARAFLERGSSASERAAELIAQLRRIVTMRSGPREPINLAVDFAELVQGRPLLSSETTYETVATSKDLWVMGNRDELRSSLVRLLNNAVTAMTGKKGKITVKMDSRLLGGDNDELGLPPGRYIHVGVLDIGIGMDSATQNRLFQPFFSTSEAGSEPRGLGLATVLPIIRAHGGAVRVTSELNVGTTIDLFLPAIEKPGQPAPAVPVSAPAAPKAPSPVRVLLVDDDDAVRGVSVMMLKMLKYDVVEANSGSDALTKLDGVAVVVTDMIMPGMSGVDLTKRILAEHPAVKVVIYSGDLHEVERAAEGAKVVPSGTLKKPFRPIELDQIIQGTLK